MIIIDIFCGIMIILASICFIYPKVGCEMIELVLMFNGELDTTPNGWKERKSTRIKLKILSLFFIGLMIMVMVMVTRTS